MEKNKRSGYDKRTSTRYMEKGLVKESEFSSYLKALPDESSNAQFVQIEMHDAELSEAVDLEVDKSRDGAN